LEERPPSLCKVVAGSDHTLKFDVSAILIHELLLLAQPSPTGIDIVAAKVEKEFETCGHVLLNGMNFAIEFLGLCDGTEGNETQDKGEKDFLHHRIILVQKVRGKDFFLDKDKKINRKRLTPQWLSENNTRACVRVYPTIERAKILHAFTTQSNLLNNRILKVKADVVCLHP